MSALSLHVQLETSNNFLEMATILQGDELECSDQPRPGAAAHRPRPGRAAPRHRGRPGQHRAQRLRHRHRPDHGRLRGEAERRPPQPIPEAAAAGVAAVLEDDRYFGPDTWRAWSSSTAAAWRRWRGAAGTPGRPGGTCCSPRRSSGCCGFLRSPAWPVNSPSIPAWKRRPAAPDAPGGRPCRCRGGSARYAGRAPPCGQERKPWGAEHGNPRQQAGGAGARSPSAAAQKGQCPSWVARVPGRLLPARRPGRIQPPDPLRWLRG